MRTTQRWDIFCRVIDNHGDLGVAWRLAADLAARGIAVRLWVDDASALAWMAPQGAAGVQVRAWADPQPGGMPGDEPGDVVVEAFGCDPPAGFVRAMRERTPAPVWINLEYLSAEPYVERSHGLLSPQQHGPGAGLAKWFFYPGFTTRTGGLLREPDLAQRQAAFDRRACLQGLGIDAHGPGPVVLLFCYEQPALPTWLAAWQRQPTTLLVTPGFAAAQVNACLGTAAQPGQTIQRECLRTVFLPYVPQPRFDELLWAADLSLVRGEDSPVRALWARRPFVWQLYPQADAAHIRKLDAFLAQFLEGAEAGVIDAVRSLHAAWNAPTDHAPSGGPAGPTTISPATWQQWHRHTDARAEKLSRQTDLATALLEFAQSRRHVPSR
jgi:uncharacterized repeat protein (TIGR03837 family)